MSHPWPGVSALGVLDGEADALAGLCERRGQSVVGYCECICGPERAIEAATAAFAAFRAGAVRATDPLSIDPEALLLGRTRAAAAQRAPKPAENLVYADVPCAQVAALLAEHATGSLSPADRDRLRRHLARCVSCRTTQAIQQQAERAYFHPPDGPLDPIIRQEIVEALRRAVPVPTPNGHRPASTPIAVAAIRQASVAAAPPRVVPQLPRKVPLAGSSSTSTPVGPSPGPAPPTSTTPGRQPARPVGSGGVPASPGPHPQAAGGHPGPGVPDIAEDDTPPNGMPAASWDSPTGVMSAVEINTALGYDHGGEDPTAYADWQGSHAAVHEETGRPADPPGGRRGLGLPLVSAGRDAARRGGARVLGPAAVLVVGLLIALFVAGVFTGGSRHPPTNPLSGAQTAPSTTLPSTGGGTSGSGASSGSGAAAGGSAGSSSGATTAASRRAAEKRAAELARQLQAGTGTAKPKTKTKTKSSSTGTAVTHTTTKPPPSTPTTPKPASPSTPKTTAGGGSTVHELGGTGSAPPATGVPAAGATGYQPG